jgi:hypothetical protein
LRIDMKYIKLKVEECGRPVAILEPPRAVDLPVPAEDPFLSIASRALPSPKRKTKHRAIDKIVYGRKS